MHFFTTAFIKRVKTLHAMFRFSLQGVERSSAAFSSSSLKSSQSAFRNFYPAIGVELVKEINGGVVVRVGLCCDLGNLSNI